MDKTLADLLDDIPDDTKDWLRRYDPAGPFVGHPLTILAAVKRHLPDPPYVPAVGDWVTIEGTLTNHNPRLVVDVDDDVWTANGADLPLPWRRDRHTFRPAERPEVAP